MAYGGATNPFSEILRPKCTREASAANREATLEGSWMIPVDGSSQTTTFQKYIKLL